MSTKFINVPKEEYTFRQISKGVTEVTNVRTKRKGIVWYECGVGFCIQIGDKIHHDKGNWEYWI